ncbi:pilin [Grimontia hollisae]|uniref:pilin n=1 Tax=Grimontia hollisae TaxID=673 RepID=UPI001303C0E3|nr:pilin [Grimontia hollisae]
MKKQQGFSLVELMIVVAVIGVLTAIALPAYQNFVKKSEAGAALATLNALKTNIEDHISSKGTFPDSTGTGLSDIGTAADAFKYGTLETTPAAEADAPGGSVIITFGETGSTLTNTDKIALERDSDGQWACVTTNLDTQLKPKGCS